MNKYKVPRKVTKHAGKRSEIRGKRCTNFVSIAFYLQIKIAEKMDYLDRMECQLASKHGRDIVNLCKSKASIEVDEISVRNADKISLFIDSLKLRGGKKRYFYWSDLCHLSELPRFKPSSLHIGMRGSLSHLADIKENPGFARNTLALKCGLDYPNSIQNFIELSEFFNITNFSGSCDDPALFELPKFQEIPKILVEPICIPDKSLLQLKASEFVLLRGASCSLINSILQQWFRKERDIKWLMFCRVPPFEKESVFGDIPFSLIGECEEGRDEKELWMRDKSSKDEIKEWEISEGGFICSVDRGDKKLLFISDNGFMSTVIAQEYRILKDVFGFKESDIRRTAADD